MIDYLFTDEIKREVVKVLSLNEEERQKYLEKKLRKLAKDIDLPIDWNDLTVIGYGYEVNIGRGNESDTENIGGN